jgi:DNA-binding NtrC family response regulator
MDEQTAGLLRLDFAFGRAVRVGIICGGQTCGLGQTVEELLAGDPGFRTRLFCECFEAGAREMEAFGADVIVACLDGTEAAVAGHRFREIHSRRADRPIVVIPSGLGGTEVFEYCQLGASDFLLPPLRRCELIPRLLRQTLVVQRGAFSAQAFKQRIGLPQIVGESPTLLAEIQRVPRFAASDATVMISGESGTGKEIFARGIHHLSPRANQRFVPVNCGAIPEHLVESEIFGHKRGAFTGATSDYAGLVREAEGGTLFLDEIDGLTCHAQVKLLRFLQEGEYRAVGSQQIVRANVRVVAAANSDLRLLVSDGRFRKDLYYRLNVLTLALPALRERRGDIALLARHFLDQQSALTGQPPKNLSLAALSCLLSHPWPGNVRELQNVLTRAVVLCDGGTIEPADLALPEDGASRDGESFRDVKARVVRLFEHDFLETVLHSHRGNITHAARAVKKNRRAFWELLRKHGLLSKVRRE